MTCGANPGFSCDSLFRLRENETDLELAATKKRCQRWNGLRSVGEIRYLLRAFVVCDTSNCVDTSY